MISMSSVGTNEVATEMSRRGLGAAGWELRHFTIVGSGWLVVAVSKALAGTLPGSTQAGAAAASSWGLGLALRRFFAVAYRTCLVKASVRGYAFL